MKTLNYNEKEQDILTEVLEHYIHADDTTQEERDMAVNLIQRIIKGD
ncbi:MAG: hypothetical protein ACLFMO_08450 [Eubacteriales bacterium]